MEVIKSMGEVITLKTNFESYVIDMSQAVPMKSDIHFCARADIHIGESLFLFGFGDTT